MLTKIRLILFSSALMVFLTCILAGEQQDFLQSLLPVYQRGELKLVEEMVIPGEGSGYVMAKPSVVRVGRDGSVFVLNSGMDQILKFDKGGRFIKAFSRMGSGPGEIGQCYQMEIDPQRNVVTFDFTNRRYSFFDADGQFMYDLKPKMRSLPRQFKALSGGELLVTEHVPDFESVQSGSTVSLSRFDAAFDREKKMFSEKIFDVVWRRGGGKDTVLCPFFDGVFWDLQPDGTIVTAYARDYKLEFYSPDGRLLKTVTHKADKVAVSEADKKEYFDGITFFDGRDTKKGAPPEYKKKTVFPKFKPFFDGMVIDSEGHILLRTARREGDLVIWDVFSEEGAFINTVKIPDKAMQRMPYVHRNLFYQLRERDEEIDLVAYAFR